jgi:hypothetical protein
VIATVAWKEYREHRTVWFFMAVVAVALIVVVTQVYPAINVGTRPSDTAAYLIVAAIGSVLTYGIVCGAMLLAGERELVTLPFLDALTGQRLPVWFAKLLPGGFFCTLQGLFVGVVAAVAYQPGEAGGTSMLGSEGHTLAGWQFVFVLPAIALDAFVWGLLASALCQSVLTAAGLAAMFWLLGWLFLVPCMAFENPFLPAAGRIVLDVVMLSLSAMAFCQTETTEREAPAPLVPRRVRVARAPSSWTVLIWLPLRQGWGLILILTAVALLFGLFLPAAGVLYWVSFTLLVGVLCGTQVFGGEQSEGSGRFLGNQRFPLGKVWAVKTGCWWAAALVVTLAFLLAGLFSLYAIRPHEGSGQRHLFAGSSILSEDNWTILVPLGLVYGFTIGQFYALLWRKSIVAVVLALAIAPAFALVWLPSLVFGGLHGWQVFVPPIVLLAATRLVMWAWSSTGLAVRRPIVTLASCGLLSLLWIAGALCYRILEVPNVGQSFDLNAFEQSIPTSEKSLAGVRMKRAGDMLKRRVDEHPLPAQFVIPPQNRVPDWTSFLAERLSRILKEGWPGQDPSLDRWLNDVFVRAPQEESWAQLYAEAAAMPLGSVEDPRSGSLPGDLTTARRAMEAGTFLEARALQLQGRQRDAQALDQVALMLGLSRQLRNYALTRSYDYGRQLEAKALDALDRWLADRRSPEHLRRALTILHEHEELIPPISLSIQAEHLHMSRALESGSLFQSAGPPGELSAEAEMAPLLWFAPWERQRQARMLNGLTEASLRVAELDPQTAAALLDTWSPDSDSWPQRLALDRGLALLNPADARSSTTRWARLLLTSQVSGMFHVETLEQRVRDGLAECRLRAAGLKTALLLYQQDHAGNPAPDLETLVTEKILVAVPLDPFDGLPFRYRQSDGKDVNWGDRADQGNNPALQPFPSAVLWSVGPDGIDHGGRTNGYGQKTNAKDWEAHRFDVIHSVPQWPKR